jgi:hypothetical protein
MGQVYTLEREILTGDESLSNSIEHLIAISDEYDRQSEKDPSSALSNACMAINKLSRVKSARRLLGRPELPVVSNLVGIVKFGPEVGRLRLPRITVKNDCHTNPP